MSKYKDVIKELRPKDRKKLKGLMKQAVKTKRNPGKMSANLKKGHRL